MVVKAIIHCPIDTLASAIVSSSTGTSLKQTVVHVVGDRSYVQWYKHKRLDLFLVLRKEKKDEGAIRRIIIHIESVNQVSPPNIPSVRKVVGSSRRAKLCGRLTLSELKFEQTQVDWVSASADGFSSSEDEDSVTTASSLNSNNTDDESSAERIASPGALRPPSRLRSVLTGTGTSSKRFKMPYDIKNRADRILGGKQFSTKHILRAFLHSLQLRFERPDYIDELKRASFLEDLDSQPSLTRAETEMIARVRAKKQFLSAAKRLPHTLNNPVAKFLHEGENGKLWGMSKTIVHTSCRTLFANLWCIDTYDRATTHRLSNNNLPRVVWENLNSTRSTQLSAVYKTVATLENRMINLWSTWERTVSREGRETFFIAMDNLKERPGHNIDIKDVCDVGKAVEMEVKGFFEIREISENLCEWVAFQVRMERPLLPLFKPSSFFSSQNLPPHRSAPFLRVSTSTSPFQSKFCGRLPGGS